MTHPLRHDQRRSDRVPVPIKVTCQRVSRGGVSGLQSRVIDVGAGGLELVCDKPLAKGSRLKVFLYFRNERRPVSAMSQVMWCKKRKHRGPASFLVGLRYLKVSRQDQERLNLRFLELLVNFFALGKRAP